MAVLQLWTFSNEERNNSGAVNEERRKQKGRWLAPSGAFNCPFCFSQLEQWRHKSVRFSLVSMPRFYSVQPVDGQGDSSCFSGDVFHWNVKWKRNNPPPREVFVLRQQNANFVLGLGPLTWSEGAETAWWGNSWRGDGTLRFHPCSPSWTMDVEGIGLLLAWGGLGR